MERTKWTKRYLILIVAVLMMTSIIHTWVSATPPTQVDKPTLSLTAASFTYDGTAQTGVSISQENPTAYTFTDHTKTDADDYTAKVTLNSGYVWTGGGDEELSQAWSIGQAALPNVQDIASPQTWTGQAIKPGIAFVGGGLTPTTADYEVEYSDNTAPGQATVTVTGKRNFTGTKTKNFDIIRTVTRPTINLVQPAPVFNGLPQTGVTLTNDSDSDAFTLSDHEKTEKGDYTAKVTLLDTTYCKWDNNTTAPLQKAWAIGAAPLPPIANIADQEHTGSQITLSSVSFDTEGPNPTTDDYTIAGYVNNTDLGVATVTVVGERNFAGTRTKTFRIVRTITRPTITPVTPDPVYTGSEQTGVTLDPAVIPPEYALTGDKGTAADSYTAKVTLTNEYYRWDDNTTAPLTKTWKIKPKQLPDINDIVDQDWTGQAIEPGVSFVSVDPNLTTNDYEVSCTNNTAPGKATVTVTGKRNFEGTKQKTFNIIKTVTEPAFNVANPVYTGSEQTGVTLSYSDPTSFTLAGDKGTDAGPYTASVTLLNEVYYKWNGGTTAPLTQAWSIAKANIPTPNAIPDQTYALGADIKPAVSFPAFPPISGADYEVSYNSNKLLTDNAKAIVSAKPDSINYKGSSERTFKIVPIKIDRPVAISPSPVFTGGTVKGVAEGTGYTLTGNTGIAVEPSGYKATATLEYGYAWNTGDPSEDAEITWYIVAANLPAIKALPAVTFTGLEHTPDVTMVNPVTNEALVKGTDYTLSYVNNMNAGTATVTVTGINDYAHSTKDVKFTINPAPLPNIAKLPDVQFTGLEHTPDVKMVNPKTDKALVKDTDYTLSYVNNVNAGTAIITVTGINNYDGYVKTHPFTITPTSLPNIAKLPDVQFTGLEHTPDVKMVNPKTDKALEKDTDYTLSYVNNVNAGTAIITVTGINNYDGYVKTHPFTITPAPLPEDSITLNDVPFKLEDKPFIGKPYEPKVEMVNPVTKVALVENTDYTLAYENNVNAGTATFTVTGKGNYAGDIRTHTFKIIPIKLPDIAEIPVQAYTGAAVEPNILMEDEFTAGLLVKDRDFTVAYQNNIDGAMIKSAEAGEPTAIVTGINNYAGDTKSIKFVIADKSAPVFNWAGAKDHGASLEITVQDNWGLASVKVLHNGGATLNVSFADEQERVYEYRYNISFQLPGSYKVFATDLYGHTVNLFNTSGKEEETETAYQYYADSDKDGLSDAYEVSVSRTDPKNPDSDGDGLTDGDEVLLHRTDPLSQDTDGDGLTDPEELKMAQYGFSPREHDSDKDGISDTVAASVMDRYPVWEYNSTLALELLLRPNRTGLKPALSASQVTKALENMVTYNLLTGLINPFDAQVEKGRVMFSPVFGGGRSTRANISNTETLMVSLNPQGKQLGIHRQMLVVYDKDETGATIPVQVLDLERHQNADGTPALTYSDEAQKGKDSLVVMSDANGMLLLAGNWDAAEQKTTDDLILIDVADLKAYKVPNSAGATRFDVAPDASKAAYLLGGKVYVIDLASTDIKVLENKASLLDFTSNGDLIINLSGSKATVVDLEGNETRVDFDGVVNVKQPTNNYRSVILVKDGVQIAFSFAASANIRVTGQVWLRAEEAAPNVEATMPAFNSERLHDGKIARGLKISRTHMKGLIP
ncbi:MAG: hypothetical protein ACOX7B_13825 [Christensenellales bacterium]